MRWSLIWLSVLLLANAPVTSAQSVARMATWNLAWMLDKVTFERWGAACEALNWADGASPSDTTLPFCDVHSGMAWPLKACMRNQAGGSALAQEPLSARTRLPHVKGFASMAGLHEQSRSDSRSGAATQA